MEHSVFPWGHTGRFNDYSTFIKKEISKKVQKISVNAGFSCPNRDGKLSKEGCIYCNNDAFSPDYCKHKNSITQQIDDGISFFSKKYTSMKYLAYFQFYTNTYAPLSELKKKYEEALSHPKIIGIVIGTRPDCINDEILDYIEELSKKCYLMVEFGVESVNDSTLKRINRGHLYAASVKAIEETAKRKIHNCAHFIIGLPGEDDSDFMKQARMVSALPVENLKLHQLQIHKGTVIAKEYEAHPEDFHLFSMDEYLDIVVRYLELLNPNIVLERFVSQTPSEWLIAPRWGVKNYVFTDKLKKLLRERDTWQGRLYSK